MSQNKEKPNTFIEVEIINKHYVDANDKAYSPNNQGAGYFQAYSSGNNRVISSDKTIILFDLNGKIQQLRRYKIKKDYKSKPKDLIEMYKYNNNGILINIIEQEKVNKSLIEIISSQNFYYNDKNQLIEKTFLDYKKDTIVKKITYQYDLNGNNIKIMCDSLHYVIKEYDTNNQITNSVYFNNETISYADALRNDENIKTGYYCYGKNSKIIKFDVVTKKQNYANGFLKEIEKSSNFINHKVNKKYSYYENGLLNSMEISNSFYPDNYLLSQRLTIKSDFKNTLNRKIVNEINRQICVRDIW